MNVLSASLTSVTWQHNHAIVKDELTTVLSAPFAGIGDTFPQNKTKQIRTRLWTQNITLPVSVMRPI